MLLGSSKSCFRLLSISYVFIYTIGLRVKLASLYLEM